MVTKLIIQIFKEAIKKQTRPNLQLINCSLVQKIMISGLVLMEQMTKMRPCAFPPWKILTIELYGIRRVLGLESKGHALGFGLGNYNVGAN